MSFPGMSGPAPGAAGMPGRGPSMQRTSGGMMGGGGRGGPGGGPGGGPPDLNAAAKKLGISAEGLHRALGPPPPNFERAAGQLGISADELMQALHGR
ncbi:MAG: hypothetical protein VW405_04845 [Rhodospirillaceae bacterium]